MAGRNDSGEARLFVALDLPERLRQALAQWGRLAADGAGLRAVRAESIHVTLCFLGMRPVSEIDAIGAACADAVRPPSFELATGALVGFPPRRPRVLAVAIEDGSRRLGELQDRLATALAELGVYRPEGRPFVPHATLARARGRSLPRGEEQPALAPVRFTVSSLTLFRSTPGPGGSAYVPLHSVSLDVRA